MQQDRIGHERAGTSYDADAAAHEVVGRDRPSRHGAALGKALARLADAGNGPDLPERCAGCGLRDGTYANQCAATVKEALNCVVGVEPGPFACHHGMVDGEPTRMCAGYAAASRVPQHLARPIIVGVLAELDAVRDTPDPIRERIDQWIATVDPEGKLNDYQRARLYERAKREGTLA